MKRMLVLGTCLVFHQVHASPAQACGAVAFVLLPLLPLEGASDVGLDAALIASTNAGPITFELRRVGDVKDETATQDATRDAGRSATDEDAGAPNVQLSVACQGPKNGGHLCVAKPTSPLEANTEYEWSAVVAASNGAYPDLVGTGLWSKFTTSNTVNPPASVDLGAEVLSNNRYLDPPCGDSHYVNLRVSAEMLAQPLVVNVHDVSPSYVMQPRVLTSESPAVEVPMNNPPECVRLEVFDTTGKQTLLELLCPEEILPATYFDGAGRVVTPPASATAPNSSTVPTSEPSSSNDEGNDVDHLGQRGIDPAKRGCAVGVPSSRSRAFYGWLLAAAGFGAIGWRRRPTRGKHRRPN